MDVVNMLALAFSGKHDFSATELSSLKAPNLIKVQCLHMFHSLHYTFKLN